MSALSTLVNFGKCDAQMVTSRIGFAYFGGVERFTIEVDVEQGLDDTRSELALLESARILTENTVVNGERMHVIDDGKSCCNGSKLTLSLDDGDQVDFPAGQVELARNGTATIRLGENRGSSLERLDVYWDVLRNANNECVLVLRIGEAQNYIS